VDRGWGDRQGINHAVHAEAPTSQWPMVPARPWGYDPVFLSPLLPMNSTVPYRPDGYHTVTPYLVVDDAARAIAYYCEAFGAKEALRMDLPGGKIAHAEIQIGDSRVMLSDENPQWGTKGPKSVGGTATSLMIYVEDCDAVFDRAVAAGGTVVMPTQDQFYGDRSGTLLDPFGHKWHIATCKEVVPPEELQKRAAAMFMQA
jgi:PhnB protein